MTMNHTASEEHLGARVAVLERQARTARHVLLIAPILLLCGGLGVLAKIGTAPAQEQGKGSTTKDLPSGDFSSITTRDFALLDEEGRSRLTMRMAHSTHTDRQPVVLSMLDESGNSRLELESGSPM